MATPVGNTPAGDTPAERALAEHIDQARRREFVGREKELTAFRGWLQHSRRKTAEALVVTGLAGIGKTTLLHAFARVARDLGRPTSWWDARDLVDPGDICRTARQIPKGISFLDSAEELASPAETAQVLATGLPERHLLVVAGRQGIPLQASDLPTRSLTLDPFALQDTAVYLARCGIQDPKIVAELQAATGGNPLLLALTVVARPVCTGGTAPDSVLERLTHKPITMEVFARRVLRELKGDLTLALLEAASIPRSVGPDLLAAMLGRPVSWEEFLHLASISFVEGTRERIRLHQTVAQALRQSLKWESPARYWTYKRAAFRYLSAKMTADPAVDPHELLLDRLFLCEDQAARAILFPSEPFGDVTVRDAIPAELPLLAEAWRHHAPELTGYTAAQLAVAAADTARLIDTCAPYFRLAVDGNGNILGYHTTIPICGDTLGYFLSSAATAGYMRHLGPAETRRLGACSPTETDTYWVRHLVLGETGDIHSRGALLRDLCRVIFPGYRVVTSIPHPAYRMLVDGFGFRQVAGAQDDSFLMAFPVMELDLRQVHIDLWLERAAFGPEASPWLDPLLAMDSSAWETHVRDAFRNLEDPAALGSNPLAPLAMAILAQPNALLTVDSLATMGAFLQKALQALVEEMGARPASAGRGPDPASLARVLQATYLEGHHSRETAAEKLNLPPTTYYRWLSQAWAEVACIIKTQALALASASPAHHYLG